MIGNRGNGSMIGKRVPNASLCGVRVSPLLYKPLRTQSWGFRPRAPMARCRDRMSGVSICSARMLFACGAVSRNNTSFTEGIGTADERNRKKTTPDTPLLELDQFEMRTEVHHAHFPVRAKPRDA
eukprot:4159902-Prymnesium_polylepis.2